MCTNYPWLYKVLALGLDGLWNIFIFSIWTIVSGKLLDAILSNILKMFPWEGSSQGSPRGSQGSPEPSDPKGPNEDNSDPKGPNEDNKFNSVLGKRHASRSLEKDDINKRFKTPDLEDVNPFEGPSDHQHQPQQEPATIFNPLSLEDANTWKFNEKLEKLYSKLHKLLRVSNSNPNKGKTMNSPSLTDGLEFTPEDRNFMQEFLAEKHPEALQTGSFAIRVFQKGGGGGGT